MNLLQHLFYFVCPMLVVSMDFDTYLHKHQKSYGIHEYFKRKDIYEENLKLIEEHNSNPENSCNLAVNQFSDLAWDEFSNTRLGKWEHFETSDRIQSLIYQGVPKSFDWRFSNSVSIVKNQGTCGSCWAFSSTGALESLIHIKTGSSVVLSEQYLVDCSTENQGCNGGLMENAFDFVSKNGICAESDYPYKAEDGTCKQITSVFEINGYVSVPPNNESALQQAVFRQPVSVAIEADSSVFQFYSGGIMDKKGCGVNLNHGVLLVGWGEENGKKYWIVKNSWGEGWGENGYIRLSRDISSPFGQCGIARDASYPVVNVMLIGS